MMVIEIQKNIVFQMVKMEMEGFEQILSLHNDGDVGSL